MTTSLAWALARADGARFLVAGVAVAVAVAHLVVALALADGLRAGAADVATAHQRETDVLVTGPLDPAVLGQVPGVAQVVSDDTVAVRVDAEHGTWSGVAASLATPGPLRWQTLSAGRFAETPGEVVVSDDAGVAIGDAVRIASTGGVAAPVGATVVGLVDVGDTAFRASPVAVFGYEQQWTRQFASDATWRVAAAAGTAPDVLVERIRTSVPGVDVVVTGEEARAEMPPAGPGWISIVVLVMLCFAAVAALVAISIVHHTCAVVLGGRTAELAALRRVGASAAQVRGALAVTGAMLAAASSALAIVLAAVATTALGGVLHDVGVPFAHSEFRPLWGLAGAGAGFAVIAVASAGPVLRATGASRFVPGAPARVRLRSRAHVALAVAGAALTVLGVVRTDIRIACAGGLATFVALMLAAPTLLPFVLRPLRRRLSAAGPIADLAIRAATRASGHTRMTASALMVCVALSSTAVVGATMLRENTDDLLDEYYPVDLTATFPSPLPPLARDVVAAVGGVSDVASLRAFETPEISGYVVDAVAARDVARHPVAAPAPGTIVLSQYDLARLDLTAGETTEVGDAALVAVRGPDGSPPVVADTEAAAVGAREEVSAFWIRLSDPHGGASAAEAVTAAVAGLDSASTVDGPLPVRDEIGTAIGTTLVASLGVLSVVFVVAVAGVGNSVALTTRERAGESALLRIIGLGRRQLRRAVLGEAVLVAAAATLCGAVFGVVHGVAGAAAVTGLGPVSVDAVPWLAVGGIVVAGVAGGLVAAVVPAARAARRPHGVRRRRDAATRQITTASG
ncbi:FtsX-like permease family protein [Rhodococcus rhodnii]|uniref:FtsX-like permease family protein n=1 Tax=Rhodococcus rhodnii TaxID=38312 RepID=UPI000933AC62|nr:FtsX-like permease family protein [Rhodococcus rhodnii]